MRAITRVPRPSLRPFIGALWAAEEPGPATAGAGGRERMLGSGAAHLVFRLSDHPVRVYADLGDRTRRSLGHAVVGGPRATFYLRDRSRPVRTVGARLLP